MSDQSKYLRWGIPGWMMFLATLGFLLIDILFSQESQKNKIYLYISEFINSAGTASSISTAIIGLLIAAAGIPLGFLIYQFYFYVRWNSPFSRDGLFPPFVVGRLNDLERLLDGIPPTKLFESEEWRKGLVENSLYKQDHSNRWRYVENFFTEIAQKIDSSLNAVSLFTRYRYLLDLLHILGSGLFGIYLGFLGYIMFKVKLLDFSLTALLLACFSALAPLILLLEVEDNLRRSTKEYRQIPYLQFINLSVIYLYFLGAILYLGSPSPYTPISSNQHILFRVVGLAIPIGIWLLTSSKISKRLRLVEVFLLILVGALALFLLPYFQNLFTPEYWQFGWATYAFLLTNTIFIKNRQNARDDLIAMQNYTIKRYLFAPQEIKPSEKGFDIKLRL